MDKLKFTLTSTITIFLLSTAIACTSSINNSAFESRMNASTGSNIHPFTVMIAYKSIRVSKTRQKYFIRHGEDKIERHDENKKDGCEYYVIVENDIQRSWGYIKRKELCKSPGGDLWGPW